MYESKDKGFIGLQELSQLLAVLGLAFFISTNNFGANKVFMYLGVKVITVSDNEEGKVTIHLSLDLTGKHNHRVGFTRTLRMPEYTQLTFKFFAVFHRFHKIINT